MLPKYKNIFMAKRNFGKKEDWFIDFDKSNTVFSATLKKGLISENLMKKCKMKHPACIQII
jgi:hypothetical protein